YDDVGHVAQRLARIERAYEGEQCVLALVEDGRVERAEGACERGAVQAKKHLRDARAAASEVHAGKSLAKLVGERVCGLELPGKAHRDTNRAHPRAREARGERAGHVVEERVAILRGLATRLLCRKEPEGCSVSREVDVERMVRRRNGPQGGVDRGDGV